MDQRARRIRQIIEDAALAGSRPGVVPLHPGLPARGRAPHRASRWALLSGFLLALPVLLPQDAGTAARVPARAFAESAVPRAAGHGLWKFSAARDDSERQVVKVLIAGVGAAPVTEGPAADSGSRYLLAY